MKNNTFILILLFFVASCKSMLCTDYTIVYISEAMAKDSIVIQSKNGVLYTSNLFIYTHDSLPIKNEHLCLQKVSPNISTPFLIEHVADYKNGYIYIYNLEKEVKND